MRKSCLSSPSVLLWLAGAERAGNMSVVTLVDVPRTASRLWTCRNASITTTSDDGLAISYVLAGTAECPLSVNANIVIRKVPNSYNAFKVGAGAVSYSVPQWLGCGARQRCDALRVARAMQVMQPENGVLRLTVMAVSGPAWACRRPVDGVSM